MWTDNGRTAALIAGEALGRAWQATRVSTSDAWSCSEAWFHWRLARCWVRADAEQRPGEGEQSPRWRAASRLLRGHWGLRLRLRLGLRRASAGRQRARAFPCDRRRSRWVLAKRNAQSGSPGRPGCRARMLCPRGAGDTSEGWRRRRQQPRPQSAAERCPRRVWSPWDGVCAVAATAPALQPPANAPGAHTQ